MTPEFNAADADTWTLVMSIEMLSAIYHRSVGGIRQACEHHKFTPAPFLTRPYRWRKADVLRHCEGNRSSSLQRVG